jgi:subtilisin family serine protease
MKRPWVWFLSIPLTAATVPGRYIVELATDPVAAHVAPMGRRGLRSAEAAAHRARIRIEHDRARAAMASSRAAVLDSMDTVVNALVVEVPDAQAGSLARVPGVKRVHPERVFRMVLDHALPLQKAPDAWNMVGLDRAGAGMKIGIIDTGVDSSHPGFQDPSLAIPDGFPKTNAASDVAYTNNKIIVARSYASLFARRDPDTSARDRVGHGTATSMAAAGVVNDGLLATISGIAPKAWIGNYKVFGTPGVNDGAAESAILKALDDAVADGMDVISISLGSNLAPLPGNDPEVAAIERASALGVVVVVASGNNGPDPATVGSPATAPSAIAVGASENDRIFAASASLSNGGSFRAIPGSGAPPSAPLTARIVDVATLDENGLACGSLPAASLEGAIALVLRGVCTFEQKLGAVQQAGAVAALVYTDQARPDPIPMSTGAATLPAEMVSYSDGLTIKQGLTGTASATLDFSLHANYAQPDALAQFSSIGPNVDGAIKPDVVAVGTNIYTAAQKLDASGALYDPSGYGVFDGTSFSTPIVAGAAALVKAARPGLTAAQYRSLLVNNARRAAGTVQQAGAGILDASAALRATAAMEPISLSFGVGGSDSPISKSLTLTNVGTARETYLVSAVPKAGSPAPDLSSGSVTLDPGGTAMLTATVSAAGLSAGQYEGFLTVTGVNSGVESRVPYWYGVPSDTPAFITIMEMADTLRPGALVGDAIVFHVADAAGIVIKDVIPTVTAISGGGSVVGVVSRNASSPGAYGLNVRLGRTAGANVFRITAGGVSIDIQLVSQ